MPRTRSEIPKGSSRELDAEKVLECYRKYIEFLGDTDILLRTDVPRFEPMSAWEMVKRTFVDLMPGKRE